MGPVSVAMQANSLFSPTLMLVVLPQSSTPQDGGQTEPRKVLLANKVDKSLSQYVCGQTVTTIARSEPWFSTPVESSLLNQRQFVRA